jgi:hypothetical protein
MKLTTLDKNKLEYDVKLVVTANGATNRVKQNHLDVSFMDVVVLLNVSFMDAVNDSIMCIISLNCLLVTKSSSSSSGFCCGGCFLGGMVSGIEKRSSRWLGVNKEEPTHSLKRLTPLL